MKKITLAALLLGAMAFNVAADDSAVEQIKRGEYLARAGDCTACHTKAGGAAFAGGLPMVTPIGTIYSTNITPDKQHGIGDYSYDDFQKAVRHGVAKNGDTLYPAMPYPSYAVVSDEDMQALYAYFMHGVQPVAQANQDSDIPWPLSMRWPLAIWRGIFAPDVKAFQPIKGQDAVLARGQYLVEGLGHCGACHTPRSITMQEKALNDGEGSDYLSGSSAPIDGWTASNLRGDSGDGLDRWTEEQLVQFLRTGRNDNTAVFGGMTDVVQHSLQHLTAEDATAIARYLKSLGAKDANQVGFTPDDTVAKALWKGDDSKTGASVYVDNCAACHKTDGSGYQRFFPALRGNSVVLASDPTLLIHIVISGAQLPGMKGAPSTITMPAFGWRLNDQQVADVVNFIRTSWGNRAASTVSARDVAKVRQDDAVVNHQGNVDVEKLTP
ncbi:c-type cytochrome [Erwinia pyrifoliae]|uniref:c-type cytochrome n=1 Tax=Erwinia pyrifoliae TaxID=79967 RepID=UPI0001961489|nr:cytochrome c [Erwinia pyrifoliae]AUX71404.1 alcohol dehydrogenase [Erwinia pyrifoliae]MCA8874866.1 c-type cytochrome [Erwinia pyrifoliae]CAX57042.1 Gluconate 2-dehydrogenase cytochrome c subunit [Erwinia pyrifoliae Ep1/96]CAY75889.1 Gluconate 2-dehydrogenase cytochrome c subunit precursor it [Erwinia pyrifoliae DSM 12163]